MIPRYKRRRVNWTPSEDDYIRNRYSEDDIETLKSNLPGRTENSIYQRARFLEVSKY